MRHMKKYASILLALVMALALAVPALADGNTENANQGSITAPSGDRQYEVYQIFTGRLETVTNEDNTTTSKILSDIKWGAQGTGTTGETVDDTVLNALEAVNGKSNSEKLAVIEKYVNLTNSPMQTISNGQTINVPYGYYLIKDNGLADGVEDDGQGTSWNMVQLVGDITITPKSANIPTVEKKVKDDSESADWGDYADFDIGQEISYKLTATLPSNMTDAYTSYELNFVDTLSNGLDMVISGDVANSITVTATGANGTVPAYTASYENRVLRVNFADVISLGNSGKITVEYKAKLNENAVVADAGNPNSVYLEYNRDPSATGAGDKTEDDTVVVFTWNIDLHKYTGELNDTTLAGAQFQLKSGENVMKFVKVDSQTYRYDKTSAETSVDTIVTTDSGNIKITGLDEGTYTLTETKAPDGYNKLADPITVVITSTESGETGAKVLTATVKNTQGTTESEGTINVLNQSGSLLPETGGMGTKIFYVVGSVMALGAVVLLVTKRRMGSK